MTMPTPECVDATEGALMSWLKQFGKGPWAFLSEFVPVVTGFGFLYSLWTTCEPEAYKASLACTAFAFAAWRAREFLEIVHKSKNVQMEKLNKLKEEQKLDELKSDLSAVVKGMKLFIYSDGYATISGNVRHVQAPEEVIDAIKRRYPERVKDIPLPGYPDSLNGG